MSGLMRCCLFRMGCAQHFPDHTGETNKRYTKNKLEEISSTHIKPDYTLVNGNIVKSYLDAKNISVDLFTNREAAFQIRSYGWSAGVPCAFLSNFEQFAIYDCKEPPKKDMPANVGVIQLRIENKRKRKV